MRSDKEIKRIANENITNLTDEEHEHFLVLEKIRREKMAKLVKKVDGGLVANGVWSFASGVDWADWNNMQVFVPREEGGVAHHMALVPKSDYRVIDDWYSQGMAATGSRSIELDNVFIPKHRLLNTADARAGKNIEAVLAFIGGQADIRVDHPLGGGIAVVIASLTNLLLLGAIAGDDQIDAGFPLTDCFA